MLHYLVKPKLCRRPTNLETKDSELLSQFAFSREARDRTGNKSPLAAPIIFILD